MMKQSAEKTTSKNAVKTVIPSIWRTAGGKYSLIMLAIWLVVSAISLVWTPYSLLDTDGFNTWASPSGAHMLGTDGVGADVLSWLVPVRILRSRCLPWWLPRPSACCWWRPWCLAMAHWLPRRWLWWMR